MSYYGVCRLVSEAKPPASDCRRHGGAAMEATKRFVNYSSTYKLGGRVIEERYRYLEALPCPSSSSIQQLHPAAPSCSRQTASIPSRNSPLLTPSTLLAGDRKVHVFS